MFSSVSVSAQESEQWPVPTFTVMVSFSATDVKDGISFQEVSGLDIKADVFEYRHSNSPLIPKLNIPGLDDSGSGRVMLNRGLASADNALVKWLSRPVDTPTTDQRKDVFISLVNQDGGQVMFKWQLKNAHPIKIESNTTPEGKIAITSLEIKYEKLSLLK
jgi:phage tail-like protein